MEPEKPSFQKFINNIPEEIRRQQLGYVDPETTQLFLHLVPGKIITCIQENAICSPETLGTNLKLHPQQVSDVIQANTGRRHLQIRHIICKWIEATESKATVQALMEGLYGSDDTKALECIQGLEFEVAQARTAENVNLASEGEMHKPVLPPDSQFVSFPFQRTDSPDSQTMVVMKNDIVTTQRSLYKDSSTNSTEDAAEETIPTTPVTCLPILPSKEAKPEMLPLELSLQKPHESSQVFVQSTETEYVFPSTAIPSQDSMGEMKEKVSGLAENMDVVNEELGKLRLEFTKERRDSKVRFQKIEDENKELKSKLDDNLKLIEDLRRQLRELRGDNERLCTEVSSLENRLQKRESQLEDEIERNEQLKSDLQRTLEEIEILKKQLKEPQNKVARLNKETTDGIVGVPNASYDTSNPTMDPVPKLPTESCQEIHKIQTTPVGDDFKIRDNIDGILMVVNDTENRATLSLMKPKKGEHALLKATVNGVTFVIGMYGVYCVGIIKSSPGNDGQNGAGPKLTKALQVVQPAFVICIGVCFGKDERKQKLGDIIVANVMRSYTYRRIGKEADIVRSAHPAASHQLVDLFQQSVGFTLLRSDDDPVKVKVAPMISGPNLIDNVEERNKLFEYFPDAEGGEMEGAGVLLAAQSSSTGYNPKAIVIKAIVDWADGKKEKKWQLFGAHAAASYVLYHLKRDMSRSLIPKNCNY